MDYLDPFAPGDGRPLERINWASDDAHVRAARFAVINSDSSDDLGVLADMLGFNTVEMRTRYVRGSAIGRFKRTVRELGIKYGWAVAVTR